MTRSVVAQLALKDLYLTRWIVLASLAAGVVSLAISPLSPTAFYIGSVSFICVLVVLNIFLVFVGVLQEKKEKARLFVLSLPISTRQYTVVKMASNFALFFLPWLLLTGATVAVIAATSIPDGLTPAAVATATYLLCYYCVLLGVTIAAESQLWPGLTILLGNISINFAIPLIFRLPSTRGLTGGETVVWGADILTVIAAEILAGAIALVVAFAYQSRRTEFV